eukprot:6861177-Pyramimonas_sp.AAC.1
MAPRRHGAPEVLEAIEDGEVDVARHAPAPARPPLLERRARRGDEGRPRPACAERLKTRALRCAAANQLRHRARARPLPTREICEQRSRACATNARANN